jgi:hypothetical protein
LKIMVIKFDICPPCCCSPWASTCQVELYPPCSSSLKSCLCQSEVCGTPHIVDIPLVLVEVYPPCNNSPCDLILIKCNYVQDLMFPMV